MPPSCPPRRPAGGPGRRAPAPLVAAAFQAADGDGPQLVQLGTDGGFAVVALGRVLPALLLAFALVLLFFGLPKVLRPGRSARPTGPSAPSTLTNPVVESRAPAPVPAEHPPA